MRNSALAVDPVNRLREVASAAELLEAAARRLGRRCERLEIHGQTERAVVTASADADLLIVARDGARSRLGPKSLGQAARFAVDCTACPVLQVWPQSPLGVGSIPPPPRHRPRCATRQPQVDEQRSVNL